MSIVDEVFLERFARHLPLKSLGKFNQEKLLTGQALIAGLGGLGTVSADLMASIGFGHLRLVDYDVIELSNLPRQKLYYDEDVGKAKVDVAEERLKLRFPQISIDPQTTRVDALSASSLIDGMDVVIDGLDRFSTRRVLHRECYVQKIPFIFAGAVRDSANIMTISHKEGTPCLECVIGNISDDPNQRCEIVGVHPSILHFAAGIQATEAVRIFLGQKPNLEGKMMFIDLETLDFEKINFKKKDVCQVCGDVEEGDLDSGKEGEVTRAHREIGKHGKALVTSICGRDTLIIDPKWEIKWDFEKSKKDLENHFQVKVQGSNYITLLIEKAQISLLKSGVTTIRGSGSSQNAIKLLQLVLDQVFTN